MYKSISKFVLVSITTLSFHLLMNTSVKAITLFASSDTYITEHEGLGGTTSVHGLDNILRISRGNGLYRTYPIIKFDTSVYSGRTVRNEDAQLNTRTYR